MSQESVTSKDGTPIAYWGSRDGPPLVLVHGAPADDSRWTPVLPAFEQLFSVCAVDRRGRGGSGDSDAKELREGVVKLPAPNAASPDSVRAMSLDLFFNYLGVRLNGPKASDTSLTLNLEFTDTEEQAILELANGTLNHLLGHTTEEADATVTLTRSALDRVIVGDVTLADEVSSGEITVEPDSAPLEELVSLLDTFEFWFPIVEP